MFILNLPSKKKILKGKRSEAKEHKNVSENMYSSFAFKDRMTNNQLSYSETIHGISDNLSFGEWLSQKHSIQGEQRRAMQAYQCTKQFEMNCLRDKYRLKKKCTIPTMTSYDQRGDNKENSLPKLSRTELFNINKAELRQMLQTDQSVKKNILYLNKPKHLSPSNTLKSQKQSVWIRKEETRKTQGYGEQDFRMYQRAVNHMNHQIKLKNQYLIQLPDSLKVKNLIKASLKNRHQVKVKTEPINESFADANQQVTPLQFVPLDKEKISIPSQVANSSRQKQQPLLQWVRSGFVNEVYLQVLTTPQVCLAVDAKQNTALHLAVNTGNINMIRSLLKALPYKMCLSLLRARNKLGRTPLEKAHLLADRPAAECIESYLREHRII